MSRDQFPPAHLPSFAFASTAFNSRFTMRSPVRAPASQRAKICSAPPGGKCADANSTEARDEGKRALRGDYIRQDKLLCCNEPRSTLQKPRSPSARRSRALLEQLKLGKLSMP
jgi:hypothetical protein